MEPAEVPMHKAKLSLESTRPPVAQQPSGRGANPATREARTETTGKAPPAAAPAASAFETPQTLHRFAKLL
jgi:hypothetical protein